MTEGVRGEEEGHGQSERELSLRASSCALTANYPLGFADLEECDLACVRASERARALFLAGSGRGRWLGIPDDQQRPPSARRPVCCICVASILLFCPGDDSVEFAPLERLLTGDEA